MITWGLASSAMMFVQGTTSFYALRFILGAAEAGFFPGIILYLTRWLPAVERARAIALFMTATVLAGVIGGPVSGMLLSMDGFGGLRGWLWLFLLEGIPAVILGVAVLAWLPDAPKEATRLEPEERDWLTARLDEQDAGKAGSPHPPVRFPDALSDGPSAPPRSRNAPEPGVGHRRVLTCWACTPELQTRSPLRRTAITNAVR
jgi:ACS family tartrate transporter-like MFS transporter